MAILPSPLILASAMAARTQSTIIVVAALLGLLYDPIRLAEDLAVLDHVSAGRVMCVLGMGYRDEEYQLFGVAPWHTGGTDGGAPGHAEAGLDRRALRPSRGSMQVTPTPGRIRWTVLAYGGHSVAAARRAARHGLLFPWPRRAVSSLRQAYEDEARRLEVEAPGCQLTAPGTTTTAFVSDDQDGAWDELGPRMLNEIRLYREWNQTAGKSGIASLSEADTVDDLRAEQGGYRIYTSAEAAEVASSGQVLSLEPLCGGLPPDAPGLSAPRQPQWLPVVAMLILVHGAGEHGKGLERRPTGPFRSIHAIDLPGRGRHPFDLSRVTVELAVRTSCVRYRGVVHRPHRARCPFHRWCTLTRGSLPTSAIESSTWSISPRWRRPSELPLAVASQEFVDALLADADALRSTS